MSLILAWIAHHWKMVLAGLGIVAVTIFALFEREAAETAKARLSAYQAREQAATALAKAEQAAADLEEAKQKQALKRESRAAVDKVATTKAKAEKAAQAASAALRRADPAWSAKSLPESVRAVLAAQERAL